MAGTPVPAWTGNRNSDSIGLMKKAKPFGDRAKKGRGVPKDFSEYLAMVPTPARRNLITMHSVIRSTLPRDAVETISYRIPAFKNKTGVLVWFAGFADHCSLFPTASVIEMFKHELRDFSTSKGTIHFPIDKPLPKALIRQIVKARIAQSKSTGGH
jgi:uncharacterized protein YdhG (YjbR/CyaY superfamily)